MAISVVCGDCGRKYSVSDATAGKRVKCKQCGHAFLAKAQTPAAKTAAKAAPVSMPAARMQPTPARAVAPRPRHKPPAQTPEPDEYRLKGEPETDDWSMLDSAAASAAVPLQPPENAGIPNPAMAVTLRCLGASLNVTRGILGQCGVHTLVMLFAVLLGVLLAVISLVIPRAAVGAVFFFPVAAIAYFLIGLIALAAPALSTPGQLKLPVGDILFICVQLLIGIIIPLPFVVYRRQMLGSGLGRFYRNVFVLFARAVVVFLMAIVTPVLANAMGVDIGSIGLSPMGESAPAYNRNPTPSPYIPPVQQPTVRPPAVESPVQSPAPRPPTMAPPVNPAMNATRTTHNLLNLAAQLGQYRRMHQSQVPRTLDDLSNQQAVAVLRISPFDPSLGENGYVYLPDNLQAGMGRVILYDAAELAKTDSTHVLIVGQAPPVRTVTRNELAAQAGVSLPDAGN